MRPVFVLAWLWSTLAAAGPLERRAATPEYPLDALEAYAWGAAYEGLGRIGEALGLYHSASSRFVHPYMHLNLARVYLEVEERALAIASLAKYLELAPDAPDRVAVARLLAELRAAPPDITIGATSPSTSVDAVVLVDGVVVGPSPARISPTLGRHLVERISTTSYASRTLDVQPAMVEYVDLNSWTTQRGNVVITMPADPRENEVWTDGAHKLAVHRMFSLPVGRHETWLGEEGRSRPCQPIVIKVTSVDVITYVAVTLEERRNGQTCRPVTHVRTQRLSPGAP